MTRVSSAPYKSIGVREGTYLFISYRHFCAQRKKNNTIYTRFVNTRNYARPRSLLRSPMSKYYRLSYTPPLASSTQHNVDAMISKTNKSHKIMMMAGLLLLLLLQVENDFKTLRRER